MKLELGKTYRAKNGEIVKIVGEDNDELYPFEGDNRAIYIKDGRWDANQEFTEYDLIEEIKLRANPEIEKFKGSLSKEVVQCEHKNKAYSEQVLCTYPVQYPWICRDCGYEGIERETLVNELTYEQVKAKFSKEEPKKMLWDKRDYIASGDKIYHFKSEDIKEASHNFMEDVKGGTCDEHMLSREYVRDLFEKHFGEEFLE